MNPAVAPPFVPVLPIEHHLSFGFHVLATIHQLHASARKYCVSWGGCSAASPHWPRTFVVGLARRPRSGLTPFFVGLVSLFPAITCRGDTRIVGV
jgi:hypothetical protein